MDKLKAITASLAVAAGLLVAAPAWTADPAMDAAHDMAGHVSVLPSTIQWADAPSIGPGAKLAVLEGDLKQAEPFIMRIKLPPNFKIAAHTHPTYERVTVLSGALHLGIGEKFDPAMATAYPAGGLTTMSPGMKMFAFTTNEETVIQVHGIGPWGIEYLNPDEDPRKK